VTDRHQPARVRTEDDTEEPIDVDVETRIKHYQKMMVDELLNNLEQRLPIPEVVFKFRDALDFSRMPHDENGDFLVWGDDALKWIVNNKLKHLDIGTVMDQAMHMRIFIAENWDRWVKKTTTMTDAGEEEEVRKFDLAALYETIFSEHVLPSPTPPHQFLEVLDYSIAFRFTQCDTERLGRTMNLMKTSARASLGDEHFEQSVFIAYNAPRTHDINITKLVLEWEKKHHLALQKDSRRTGARSLEVISRMKNKHKVTFLH